MLIDQLMKINANFTNTITNVGPFSNVFKEKLDELLNHTLNQIMRSFLKIQNKSEIADSRFNNILNEIDSNDNSYLNNIESVSDLNVKDFIQNSFTQINTIFEAIQIFFSEIQTNIDYQNQLVKDNIYRFFHFDICTYYDIKDMLREIVYIYENFEEGIKNAIKIENDEFYDYIIKQFIINVDEHLKKVESHSESMKYQQIIKYAFNNYYNNLGDTKRNDTIKLIDSFRTQLYNIFKKIFDKINEKSEENISSANLSQTLNALNNQLEIIERDYTLLLNQLKPHFKYDENYEIYYEDLNTISSIYLKATEIRTESTKNIIDSLTQIMDDYKKEILDTFDQESKVFYKAILNHLQTNNYNLINQDTIDWKDKINKLSDEYLNQNFILNWKNKLSNEIQDLSNNYYEKVLPAFENFETQFLKENFEQHKDKYITKPTELINKLNQIKKIEENEFDNLIEKINKKNENDINSALNDICTKNNILIKQLINDIYINIQRDQFNYSSYSNYNRIRDNLNSIKFYFDNFEIQNFSRKEKDEFKVKGHFQNNENNITEKILGNLINQFSDENICSNNNQLCENGVLNPNLTTDEKYDFQISKLRDSISYLKELIKMADDRINDNILYNLNSNKIIAEYNQQLVSFSSNLITDIYQFLDELNEETREFWESYTSELEFTIIGLFTQIISRESLREETTIIAQKIFIDPIEYQTKLQDYLYSVEGPFSKIHEIFNKEIEDFKKDDYEFDFDSYNKHYKQFIDNLVF